MELLSNPIVAAFLIGLVLILIVKAYDQWRDARQKTYQEIGDAFDVVGQDVAGNFWKALARDAYEDAVSIGKSLVERLKKPGGVNEVLATMMVKSLKDKDFTDSAEFKSLVQPVLVERVLGALFDPALKAELLALAPVLREYGSQQFADILTHLVLGNVEAARATGHQLVSVLRNTDQLDDELVKRAAKAIPRAVQADARHWAVLNDIITKAKPAA